MGNRNVTLKGILLMKTENFNAGLFLQSGKLSRLLLPVSLLTLTLILLLSAVTPVTLLASDGPSDAPSLMTRLMGLLPMFLMVFLIFYTLVISPQKKQQLAHENLISNLKKGDQVLTSGGIWGKISNIEQDFILLEVSNGVKIKVRPANISGKWQVTTAEAGK